MLQQLEQTQEKYEEKKKSERKIKQKKNVLSIYIGFCENNTGTMLSVHKELYNKSFLTNTYPHAHLYTFTVFW